MHDAFQTHFQFLLQNLAGLVVSGSSDTKPDALPRALPAKERRLELSLCFPATLCCTSSLPAAPAGASLPGGSRPQSEGVRGTLFSNKTLSQPTPLRIFICPSG